MYGVAAIVTAGWETASSVPSRSKILPRRAGTMTWDSCCTAAACLSVGLDDAEPARPSPPEDEQGEEDGEQEADAALDEPHGLFLTAVRLGGQGPRRVV